MANPSLLGKRMIPVLAAVPKGRPNVSSKRTNWKSTQNQGHTGTPFMRKQYLPPQPPFFPIFAYRQTEAKQTFQLTL